MRILLVQPQLNPSLLGAGTAFLTEPLSLEILAACVPHHDVSILDMRLESSLDETLADFSPDIVGVTGCTTDYYAMVDILRRIKQYNSRILAVVGGHHATMAPRDFDREYIDVIVIGEGDVSFPELVERFARQESFSTVLGIAYRDSSGILTFTELREPIQDLDRVPLPDRKKTSRYRHRYFRGAWRPMASIMSSKGCPYRCSFCACWKINGGKYVTRSPESVVGELRTIQEPFVDFAEDNSFCDIARARRLALRIKESGIAKTYKLYIRTDTVVHHPDLIAAWREIGLRLVLLGLESFKDEDLRSFNKRSTISMNNRAVEILHRNDIEVVSYFIIKQEYSRYDFEQLAAYVEKMGIIQPVFTVLTPLPGTQLYEERYQELTTHNYELFDFAHSVLPTRLPLEEFYACLLALYRRFYGKGEGNLISSPAMFEKVHRMLSEAHRTGNNYMTSEGSHER